MVVGPTSAATIRPNDDDERLAREGLEALASEGKLGALLIQFPFSFKNTSLNREYLETLLRQFIEYPRVVEVRHSSWDNPETLASFERTHVAFCNVDQPLIGRSLEPTEHVTSPVGYVRLHGRNYDQWFEADTRDDRYNYLYSETELSGWKDKIERIAHKAEVTYVVTNNHFEGKAGGERAAIETHVDRTTGEGARTAVAALSRAQKHCRPFARLDLRPAAAGLSAEICPRNFPAAGFVSIPRSGTR